MALKQIIPKLINMVALKRADWVVDLRVYYALSLDTGLLRQEDCIDVRQHASLRDGHALQQFVELFVVQNGK